MTHTLKTLMASARVRRFSSEAAVDAWLDDQRVTDPQTRIAAKLELQAQGLATDQDDRRGLATDTAVRAPAGNHLQRVLDRAGIRPLATYDERDVDALLKQADITDIETRLAVKTEMRQRQQLR
jgi:hypothetical protein